LWYGALERVEASRVAALLYLEPLVTLAAAVALLGEPVGFTTVAGGLLVLGGVFLVQTG
jgi:drug/metabolite transporter (DMT)-like permease